MNEQKIQDLKDALREVMMMIAERNQPVSDEMKAAIVQVMEHVANRIQQLRAEESNIKVPPLNSAEYPSAQINSFNYDPKKGALFVKFQGDYPNQNGPIYRYSNIPQNIFNLFKRGAVAPKTSGKNAWHEWKKGLAPSLGASMNALIKSGGYSFQKVA